VGRAVTNLICVGPGDVDRVWPLVSGLIAAAYAKTDDLVPELLPWLKRGDGLLWIAANQDEIMCAVTTSFVQRASGKVLRIWACGGAGIEVWLDHLAEIEDYGRKEGCVKVCFDGRRGWEKFLPDYRVATVALEKRL
jgi:hypothetical protein